MPDRVAKVIVCTDGGSRGNPGPAAAGYVLKDESGSQLAGKGLFLGEATNNVAEYTALLRGLEAARTIGAKTVSVLSDSELMVKQVNGEYKVKSEQLRPFFEQVMSLLDEFDSHRVRHITRDKNAEADRLVNRALDLKKDVESAPARRKANKKKIRLGVLISGGGTTLLNILECIEKGQLSAEVALVISSRAKVKGVERAKNAGLDVKIIRKKDYPDVDDLSKQIEDALVAADVDLVVQGGWLCLWNIPKRYENRVMNIHPALLPSFGGQGMWGHHVHEAVLAKGCKISGCTVHFCTNEYDEGPMIVQRSCPVKEGDDADTLAARVFEQECIAYPEAIRLFADGLVTVKNSRVHIRQD